MGRNRSRRPEPHACVSPLKSGVAQRADTKEHRWEDTQDEGCKQFDFHRSSDGTSLSESHGVNLGHMSQRQPPLGDQESVLLSTSQPSDRAVGSARAQKARKPWCEHGRFRKRPV